MYKAEILADSIGPHGVRLTTFEITFPRFILAELNTHRMLSRNSASSRAIPTEKQIENVKNRPFIPEFNKRVTGMGVGEPLEGGPRTQAQAKWLKARDAAIEAAEGLLHVDKSRANRLLEPFMWHTAIVSATDWDNFYALRDHEAAQPEFRKIAGMMRVVQAVNIPRTLAYGEWHLPLWFDEDMNCAWPDIRDIMYPAKVSAGRCARVSYDRQHDAEPAMASRDRWDMLSKSGHWSPGEHPAQCEKDLSYRGNFRGWKQLRKFYLEESVFTG